VHQPIMNCTHKKQNIKTNYTVLARIFFDIGIQGNLTAKYWLLNINSILSAL
jgi:hypothetical protein